MFVFWCWTLCCVGPKHMKNCHIVQLWHYNHYGSRLFSSPLAGLMMQCHICTLSKLCLVADFGKGSLSLNSFFTTSDEDGTDTAQHCCGRQKISLRLLRFYSDYYILSLDWCWSEKRVHHFERPWQTGRGMRFDLIKWNEVWILHHYLLNNSRTKLPS